MATMSIWSIGHIAFKINQRQLFSFTLSEGTTQAIELSVIIYLYFAISLLVIIWGGEKKNQLTQ